MLKQIVEDWSKDPINNDPFFLFRQDPNDNFMCSVTKYDFAQVLSKSYVSDNFIATYQKLLPDYFEGSHKVLFLAPTLWTSLKMFREQARFRKDYNLDYYDAIFWTIHMPRMEHYVVVVHEPADKAAIRYYDSLGKKCDRKERFSTHLHDLVEVINIFGQHYNRTWGEGCQPDFVEVPCQLGNDCGLVANQIAMCVFQGTPVETMDMDSSLMRVTQAAVVWDAMRTRLVQLK